jgi:NAD(P)-dependent dehydrogenase (short-subunit alcohol dehydrogenase family)
MALGQALGGSQYQGPYCASKHAALGLVRSAALDHARDGIRVNAVCPGYTQTKMLSTTEAFIGGDARAQMESTVPLDRYGRPSEMRRPWPGCWGRRASYVTGEHLVVDGGIQAAAAGFMPPAGARGA